MDQRKVGVLVRLALGTLELLFEGEGFAMHFFGSVEVTPSLIDQPEAAVLVRHPLEAPYRLVEGQGLAVHLLGPVEIASGVVDQPEVTEGCRRVGCLSVPPADRQPALQHLFCRAQWTRSPVELKPEIEP